MTNVLGTTVYCMYLILIAVMRLWCYLPPDNYHEKMVLFTISPLSWYYNGIETQKLGHTVNVPIIFPYSSVSLDHWIMFNALKTQR